jgi:glycerophosphoryl diester phosphodiesterase
MDTTTLPKTLICAHRGASAHAPENTLAAFRLAVDHRADAVELDAKLTLDGEVIVIHDTTTDRTTNGKGRVRDYTLAQMKALDAGSWKGPEFAGEPIPTLAEVFEAVGEKLMINVELTNYATLNDTLVEKVIDLVRHFRLQKSVFFSSFSAINLLKAQRLAPEIYSAILTLPGYQGWLYRSVVGQWITPKAIHPYYTDVTEAFVKKQHALNRRIHTWTVDPPEEIQRLIRIGTDGIITNDPRLARDLLEAQ